MNLNHLYYFKILAQTENYTEAAKLLMISQPSLSYAIKNLEENLDVPLFEKKGRNVYLTSYGIELKKTTLQLFDLLDTTIHKISEQREHEKNTVSIGLIPTLASSFFPELIKKGKQSQQLTQDYELYNGYTKQIINKLLEGTYDIGICSKQDHPEITFIPIKKHPFILLFNPSLFDETIERITTHWFEFPLVTYRANSPISPAANKVIHQFTSSPTIVETLDDETFIGGYVAVNPCIALVAKTPILKQFQLTKIPLNEEKYYHTTYLAFLKKNQNQEKIQKLIEQVIQESDFK